MRSSRPSTFCPFGVVTVTVTGADAEVAPYPFTTREPARAMADVPDPRLDAIADAQDIPKRVPAQVQLVDIAGLAAGAGT